MTHIVTRFSRSAVSGIDQVDLAYARHFVGSDRLVCGLHYGLFKPHLIRPERVRDTLLRLERKRAVTPLSLDWPSLRAWLVGEPSSPNVASVRPPHEWRDFAHKWKLRLIMDGAFALPDGAIYLNAAQHALEFPRFFHWLEARPDLLPVFLVHDLLPLDLPEFFKGGYEVRFARRLTTIFRHARAIITTSQVVRERVQREYAKRGRRPVPIHVQPLASGLAPTGADIVDKSLRAHPYFVVVSTIEPRKNHLMLLHVWRRLAEMKPDPPKLVIIGLPGWDCDHTLSMLRRSPSLRRCVNHVSILPELTLRALLANARALLMPSFAEGYGLPIVEALSLGTPVIVSDIPVFHEVAQRLATFVSPLAGDAWATAILEHVAHPSKYSVESHAFAAPNWRDYFAGIEGFFDRI